MERDFNKNNLISKPIIMNKNISKNSAYLMQLGRKGTGAAPVKISNIIELYNLRKISQVQTAENVIQKLINKDPKIQQKGFKQADKIIESHKEKEPLNKRLQAKADASGKGPLAKGKKQTWLIRGEVKIESQYYKTKKSGNKELDDRVYHDTLQISHQIEARSKDEAVAKFDTRVKAEVQHEEGDDDSNVTKSSKVNGPSNIKSAVVMQPGAAQSEAHTPMREASYVKYGFIPSEDKYLKNEGFCVIDNFVGMYSPHIKRLTVDYFNQLVSQIRGVKDNGLDFGLDYSPVVYVNEGVTPAELMEVCKIMRISMYAYDITNKNFLKHVVPSSQHNYPPLVYYAVGNHMYLISEKEKAISLIRKAANTESKIRSIVLEDESLKLKNRFAGLDLYSDIPIRDLANCKDGANIISKSNLNDELVEYIKTYNTVPTNIKNRKVAIVEFFDKINNVIVATDPNDTRHYNYQMVKRMCDDKGIEFANQSFASMVKQMRKEFVDIQRASFSKEFRA